MKLHAGSPKPHAERRREAARVAETARQVGLARKWQDEWQARISKQMADDEEQRRRESAERYRELIKQREMEHDDEADD